METLKYEAVVVGAGPGIPEVGGGNAGPVGPDRDGTISVQQKRQIHANA